MITAEIRGWGGREGPVIQTLRQGRGGGARSPTKLFRTFGPQFGLKIRGPPPLDPPLFDNVFSLIRPEFILFFLSYLNLVVVFIYMGKPVGPRFG